MLNQKVSLIILNYNGLGLLKKCLPSVVEAARYKGANHEIVLLDNRSTDNSVQYIKDSYPHIKIIISKKNNFMFSYNNVIKQIDSDIVVLLNNDVFVENDFIGKLLPYFKRPDTFAITPKMLSADGKKLLQGRRIGSIKGGFIHPSNPGAADERGYTLFASAGACAVSKEKFNELGGFDDLYWPFYHEDLDLSYRAWMRGYKVFYEPKSVVYHFHSASIKKIADPNNRSLRDKINYLFVWKNITDFKWIAKHLFWILIRVLKSLLLLQLPRVMALFQALTRLPKTLNLRKKIKSKKRLSDSMILDKIKMNNFSVSLEKKNILIFGYSKWNVWRTAHEFAEELSKKNEVIFVEAQTKNIFQAIPGLFFKNTKLNLKNNIKIYIPPASFPVLGFVWPKFMRRCCWFLSTKASKHSLKTALDKTLKKNSFKPDITFIFNPSDLYLAKKFNENVACYRVYDEVSLFPSQSRVKESVDDFEKEQIKYVDYIFASSNAQAEKRKKYSNNVHLLRNAYNEYFNNSEVLVPEDLKRIISPRIGFVGVIDHRIDFNLIDFTSRKLNNMSFIFIGPVLPAVENDVKRLSENVNVYFIGEKSPKDVLAYLKGIDISIIPYLADKEQVQCSFPWKVYEHLAAGIPIVSVNLKELEDFKDYINLAGSHEEFCKLINENVGKRNSEQVKAGVQFAKSNTWGNRVKFINKLLMFKNIDE